jgi:hypothetical protein
MHNKKNLESENSKEYNTHIKFHKAVTVSAECTDVKRGRGYGESDKKILK